MNKHFRKVTPAQGNRTWYELETPLFGESLLVEVTRCERGQLTKLWHKSGHTPNELPSYWNIHTYAYSGRNDCKGYYNPTNKLHESGGRFVINLEWMLEATPENLDKLLNEIYRRYMAGEKLAV